MKILLPYQGSVPTVDLAWAHETTGYIQRSAAKPQPKPECGPRSRIEEQFWLRLGRAALYRRVVIGRAVTSQYFDIFYDPQNAILRYSRVQLCATIEIAHNLTLAVGAINVWNRLNIAFRTVPGVYKPHLRDPQFDTHFLKTSIRNSTIGIALYVVALLISYLSDEVTMTMYGLIPFLFLIPVRVKIGHAAHA